MAQVIRQELEIIGSHGIQAYRYQPMLDMIAGGRLNPARLVGQTISLAEAPEALMAMGRFQNVGVTVVTRF